MAAEWLQLAAPLANTPPTPRAALTDLQTPMINRMTTEMALSIASIASGLKVLASHRGVPRHRSKDWKAGLRHNPIKAGDMPQLSVIARNARLRREKARRSYRSSFASSSSSSDRSSSFRSEFPRKALNRDALNFRMRSKSISASAAWSANSPMFGPLLPCARVPANRFMSSLNEGSDPIATDNLWRTALPLLRRLPPSDRGPVLFLAFFRLETILRSDVMWLRPVDL